MNACSSSAPDRRGVPAPSGYPLLAFALLMTALAYFGTLHFRFVYDDGPQIIQNPMLTSWHSIPALFQSNNWRFLLPNWAGNYYRPIFMSWLLLNRMLWGLNPAPWHASAVVLHLFATFLSFVVARQIFGNGTPAGLTAMIFGLHPIHIESVAWISGATDSLMTVFVFAAFWACLRGDDSPRPVLWRLLAATFYLLACLSKETALPLPLAIAAYLYLVRRDGALRSFVRTWPLWISAAIYLVARIYALRGFAHPVGVPLSSAVLNAPVVSFGYLRRLLWPVGLSLFYDTPAVTGLSQWRFWLPLIACLGAAVVAWRFRKRLPLATFALLWTFLFLIPAIAGLAIFPVGEWIHDRYLYLPSFGLCLYLGFLIGRLRSEQKLFGLPALSTTAAMMLAAILSFGTAWQQQFWANSLVLYVHAVNEAPQNPWPKGYLAGELLRRGDRMNARRMYEAALALDPKNWKNNVAYGLMLYDEHDYRGADEYITRALNGDPSDPNAHFDQGLSRLNYGNYASAESSFREAVRRNPSLPEVHYWLGVCLENQGKLNEARSEYQSEFQLHPDTTTNAEQRFRELAPK